jgi:3-deoxy-manno-octulosonate cytidylyltransferase (CMP-KDO synthetase)
VARPAAASTVAVIPARYASSRFPGKVLADRTGKPLIQHVWERLRQARRVGRVIVAADDPRIVAATERFGGEAVLTRPDHANGTSRTAEVAQALGCELVVNVQADEPEIEPGLIDRAVEALEADHGAVMATVASPFAPDEDPSDPDIVKVVIDLRGRALYFSRALIPHLRADGRRADPLKHVGLYVYRRPFLAEFAALEPTPLEQAEKLEQLRVLEHGHAIAVAVGEAHHHGIDTPRQYEEFCRRASAGAPAASAGGAAAGR